MEWMKKNKWSLIGGLFFLLSLSLIIYGVLIIRSNTILQGVRLGPIDLSGLSQEQAKTQIENYLENKKKQSLRLRSDVTSYSYTFEEMGFSIDVDKTLQRAYGVGRDQKNLKNVAIAINRLMAPKSIEPVVLIHRQELADRIHEMERAINRESKNATLISSEDGSIGIQTDRAGVKLNRLKAEKIFSNLSGDEKVLDLPIDKVQAQVKKEDLAFVNGLLATYSTDYSKSEGNRKDNIALGSSFFSEMIVRPGQEVSFLKTIGGIDKSHGFKESGVIIDGEFDRGIGGGICQVSTTLYNALIRADLEIVERHNHSRPIGYVPRGTDAAVMDGYKDLVFKNPYKNPIYLMAKTNGQTIEYMIYGNKEEKPYDIEIVPESLGTIYPKVEKVYSSSLYQGEEKVKKPGGRGFSYRTWRVKMVDGKEAERTLLSKSYYIPQKKVVLVGTKSRPQESTEKSNKENE